MIPYSHQTELAKQGYSILKENAIVYLAMEERTGKTLTSILICEMADISNILVITKKKALDGWKETLSEFKHNKSYHVINYHKVKTLNVDPSKYDLIILDEAHNYISGSPKIPAIWLDIKPYTKDKPIIYMSATPYAQGAHMLYHQLALSSWSPFRKYTSFYKWFSAFGIPSTVRIAGGMERAVYTKSKTEDILALCNHLFIRKSRQDLDFEHEPEDILHYIELDESTKEAYNFISKNKIIDVSDRTIILDTVTKLRYFLHMLEGGVCKDTEIIVDKEDPEKIKTKDIYFNLNNKEKIDFILDNFGDSKDVVIMYNYKAEKEKLHENFKNATILQATSFSEGVDLSGYEHLIIYSQDFSTARHSQRRARQANKNRSTPIKVHYLLVKDAISEQVYETVSINKVNFIDSLYKKVILE